MNFGAISQYFRPGIVNDPVLGWSHLLLLPLHAYFGRDLPPPPPPGPGPHTPIPQLTEAGAAVNYLETQAGVGETSGVHLWKNQLISKGWSVQASSYDALPYGGSRTGQIYQRSLELHLNESMFKTKISVL